MKRRITKLMTGTGAAIGLLVLALVGVPVEATTPKIDYVLYDPTPNWVTIHFDTDAHRTYVLQYSPTPFASGSWSNMQTFGPDPAPSHYVWFDYVTSTQRFYRLRVTP